MEKKQEFVIRVENLKKIFAKKSPFEYEALKCINLKIKPGEFIAIAGETGSGKSTLVTHFNGLIKPTFGEVTIFDYSISHKTKKIKKIKKLRKKVGMVFQFPEYQLFEETVLKDITFGPRNFGQSKEEAEKNAYKYIEILKIPKDAIKRSPFELSGGQKRKVAIAGILSIENDVIIFDEPTAGLDPESEQEVLDLCKKLNRQGKTIIMVTHNMDNILKYASKVFVLNNGVVSKECRPYELFEDYNSVMDNHLQMPKVYDFLHKFERGNELSNTKLTTIDDLATYLLKSKKKVGKK